MENGMNSEGKNLGVRSLGEGSSKKNRPVKTFRAGTLSATVWQNVRVLEDGSSVEFTNVTFERRYKDKNDEWRRTHALRVSDLPKAALVLQKAYEFLSLKNFEESVV